MTPRPQAPEFRSAARLGQFYRAMVTAIAAGHSLSGVAYASTDCGAAPAPVAISACSVLIGSDLTPTPERVAAYVKRAEAQETLGDHDAAIADLDKAIKLNPKLAGPYSNRGNIHFALGNLDAALADYDRAIALDASFAGAFFNRGNVYARKRQWDKAITDLSTAVKLDPDLASAFFNRGIYYLQLKRLAEARADFRKTLQINPGHEGAARALKELTNDF